MEFIPIYFSKNLKISNKVEISLFNLTLALARYDLAKVTYGLKHEIFFQGVGEKAVKYYILSILRCTFFFPQFNISEVAMHLTIDDYKILL